MLIGPRNSVVAEVMGVPADWAADTSPWVVLPSTRWEFIRDEYPELWVDRIHDYVHVGEDLDGA